MKGGENRFANSLTAVLEDAFALRVFSSWLREGSGAGLGSNGGRGESNDDAIQLHFAIKSYKEKVNRGEANAPGVACALHRRFISLRSGSCDFLPDEVRAEVSKRVHAITEDPPADLFEPVTDPLHRHLRAMHALFVCSQSFFHMQRELSNCDADADSDSGDEPPAVPPHANRFQPVATFSQPKAKPRTSRASTGGVLAMIARATTSKDTETSCPSRFGTLEQSAGGFFQRNAPIREDQPVTVRHEMPEGREAFVGRVAEKLNMLLRESGGNSSLYKNKFTEVSDELSTSDEEIDRYVDRIEEDNENRRSKSVSPVVFVSRPAKSTVSTYGGVNGFAPPPSSSTTMPAPPPRSYDFAAVSIPGSLMTSTAPRPNHRNRLDASSGAMRFSDSSGFCSAESAFIPPDTPSTSGYSKRRHHNFGDTSTMTMRRGGGSGSSGFGEPPQFHPAYVTMPRRRRDDEKITLSLREKGQPAPLVAKVPAAEISFRDFRHTFGISSKSKKRLLFKSVCEDGSAPYQWSVITDDDTVLPLFEGRITAECRGNISDSD